MEDASIFLKSLWSNNATAVIFGHLELSFTSCGRSNENKWCWLFVSFIPVHFKVNCVTDWLPCESNMTRCGFTNIKCSYWVECLSLLNWNGLWLCLWRCCLHRLLLKWLTFFGSWVCHRKYSRFWNMTHFLVFVNCLNSDNIIFALHGRWSFQPVSGLAVSSINTVWWALAVFLCDKKPVLDNRRSTSFNWFFPCNLYRFLR